MKHRVTINSRRMGRRAHVAMTTKVLDRAIEALAEQFGGLGTVVSRVQIVVQTTPEVLTCMGHPIGVVLARARELLNLQTQAKLARCEVAARKYREVADSHCAPVVFDEMYVDIVRTFAQEYRAHIEFVLGAPDDFGVEDPHAECIY